MREKAVFTSRMTKKNENFFDGTISELGVEIGEKTKKNLSDWRKFVLLQPLSREGDVRAGVKAR
ncbi:MAG: hypothetical protein IJR13_03685, partial [Bacteroidales bacterium]|nr:hypothetical protein [Bacteroidales bacterium]